MSKPDLYFNTLANIPNRFNPSLISLIKNPYDWTSFDYVVKIGGFFTNFKYGYSLEVFDSLYVNYFQKEL